MSWDRFGLLRTEVGKLQITLLAEALWKVCAKEGDGPVGEKRGDFLIDFPSTAGHEKSCGNPGGPPPKAKYSLVTDSEPVP